MSSIREEPKTRAQRIPQSHGLNSVISNKRLSFVDLDSVHSSSESKMSHSSSLHALQPRSSKNIDSSKLFNNNTFNDDTDDIDQMNSPRETGTGINLINDT
jgi:hypothetical protein